MQRYAQSAKGREAHRRAVAAWKLRNVDKNREWLRIKKRVQHAIKAGRLVRASCQVCGDPDTHGHHHRGYAPEHVLDVVWLCPKHHTEAHGRAAVAEVVA